MHRLRLVALAVLIGSSCAGEERFVRIAVAELRIPSTAWPPDGAGSWRLRQVLRPYIGLDGAGEARLGFGDGEANAWRAADAAMIRAQGELVARMPADATELRGWIAVPDHAQGRLARLRFAVPLARATVDAEAQRRFRGSEIAELERHLRAGVPGSAWFRHRLAALGGATPEARGGWRGRDADDAMDLFSGGRAVAENLQLDRGLRVAGGGPETVRVADLAGITIAAFDWKPLLAGRAPALDRLAASIPADQHAVLMPGFAAMLELMERADALGTPLLHGISARAEDACTAARYQRQLCLEPSELARRFGPQLIDSVALTGGDPFLRTGSDVAVLFAPKQAALLSAFIAQKQAAAVAAGAQAVRGDVRGIAYAGAVTADRAVCSYLAEIGGIVVVANALTQLDALAAVAQGALSLAAEDEFRFFRDRYPLGAEGELALVVLSDAAIRRWCSPRWRIGEARRTRSLAILSELHARQAQAIGAGRAPAIDAGGLDPAGLGELRAVAGAVHASTYGTLRFATPLAELPLERCTEAEADAYARWREDYQRNWSRWFDPIALRVTRRAGAIGLDLSVMPLIAGSEYRHMLSAIGGAQLAPQAGDPHAGTLWHWCMALDATSEPVRQAGTFVAPYLRGMANPLGWLGASLSFYADDRPFWRELAAADDGERFLEDNWWRLPVAMRVEVADQVLCTAFLGALRAFVEGVAPDVLRWETRDVDGQAYVRVVERDPDGVGARAASTALCYALARGALVLSPDEEVVRASLRRGAAGAPAARAAPWLGRHVGARAVLSREGAGDALRAFAWSSAAERLRLSSWANLHILNVWKRLLPDLDPLVVHERIFGVRPVCPGGGGYVWDADWRTMASTAYGHPGDPRRGPAMPSMFAGIAAADAGLTFEHGGLRAVLELRETPAPAPSPR